MAKAKDVDVISITDHDTLYGIDANKALAAKYDISYIPGIEISAYDYKNSRPCHLVGLNVKSGYKPLEDMIESTTKQRHENSNSQIKKLIDLGYDISFDDFSEKRGAHGIYKQHIMHVLLEKGIVNNLFSNFYKTMFKNGGPLEMHIEYPSHVEAVRVLAESGASAILAHPTLYDNTEEIPLLKDNGLMGIEASYPSLKDEDKKALLDIGEKYDLFLSAGSDYHGFYGSDTNGHIGSHYVYDVDSMNRYFSEYNL
jgi:predicted metal-dependent phosphoesterase TrpH